MCIYIKSIFTFTTCHLSILEWCTFEISGESLFGSHLYACRTPHPDLGTGTSSTLNSSPFLFFCQMFLFTGNWRHMYTRDRNRNNKTQLDRWSSLFHTLLCCFIDLQNTKTNPTLHCLYFPWSQRTCFPLLRLTKPFFSLYSVASVTVD